MNQYSLLTEKYRDTVMQKLQQSPSSLTNEWDISELEKVTCFSYKFNKKDENSSAEKIAGILSEIIQHEIVETFSQKYLNAREDLSLDEKKHIQKMFMVGNCFTCDEGISYIAYYLVYAPVLEFLKSQKHIHLDGWIMFRTSQYRVVLKEMLEQVIMDYLLREEYEQFVFLLKENKKLQVALEDEIHLVPNLKDGMHILNQNGKDVTEDYIAEYCEELLSEEDAKIEDLLMNVLVTVSPKRIIVHQKSEIGCKELLSTICLVFFGEITYCEGCKHCLGCKNLLNS